MIFLPNHHGRWPFWRFNFPGRGHLLTQPFRTLKNMPFERLIFPTKCHVIPKKFKPFSHWPWETWGFFWLEKPPDMWCRAIWGAPGSCNRWSQACKRLASVTTSNKWWEMHQQKHMGNMNKFLTIYVIWYIWYMTLELDAKNIWTINSIYK